MKLPPSSSKGVVPEPYQAAGSQYSLRDGVDGLSGLELVSRYAITPKKSVSLLFVHGINVGAWIWSEHFLDYFAAAGFDSHAISLRGHGRSWGADRIRDWRLADYVDDVEVAVDAIGKPLVLVGHSMGGAVVQKFVQRGHRVAGMALMASVPPWGLALSALRIAATSPETFVALQQLSFGQLPPANSAFVRRMLFSPDTTDAELGRFISRAGLESPHVGWELQGWPPLAPAPWLAPDTFVVGGGDDALVPSDEVRRTAIYYGRPCEIVPRVGHMLMLGPRWEETSSRLKCWLLFRFPAP